jgi:hypothetical protein
MGHRQSPVYGNVLLDQGYYIMVQWQDWQGQTEESREKHLATTDLSGIKLCNENLFLARNSKCFLLYCA